MAVPIEGLIETKRKLGRFAFRRYLAAVTGDSMGVVVVDMHRLFLYRLRGESCYAICLNMFRLLSLSFLCLKVLGRLGATQVRTWILLNLEKTVQFISISVMR